MCMKVVPLPDSVSHLNPDWVLLTLIYWNLAIPEIIGVLNAWVVGIIMDVLTGRSLGQQALAYALVSFISLKFYRRLRQYPLIQQSLFVFVSLLFAQLLIFWLESMGGTLEFSSTFLVSALVGALFWPIIYLVLRYVRTFGRNK